MIACAIGAIEIMGAADFCWHSIEGTVLTKAAVFGGGMALGTVGALHWGFAAGRSVTQCLAPDALSKCWAHRGH